MNAGKTLFSQLMDCLPSVSPASPPVRSRGPRGGGPKRRSGPAGCPSPRKSHPAPDRGVVAHPAKEPA